MSELEIIDINDMDYYNASELHKKYPNFFYGCANNTRNIIKKKKITEENILWAYLKNGKWICSNSSYAKAKLLLSREWVCNNVPNFIKNNKATYEIEPAPPILELDDNEKLTDVDGNIIEIETRGERSINECYFKVKDISRCFEMKYLNKSLTNNNAEYEKNVHYKTFTFNQSISNGSIKGKNTTGLFLTYKGLLRCLYVSKNKNADRFQDWANNILFTVHMGTKEQKEVLTSKLMGVTASVVKEVFKTSSDTVPCIYLFVLGTVKDLRKSMNIDQKYEDDSFVVKYGFTDSIARRTYEHMKTYGKIKGADLKLKLYSYVDPLYVSSAENDIKYYFAAFDVKLEYKCHDELVVIKPSNIKLIEKQYKQISDLYGGHIKEMINKMECMKRDMQLLEEKHKIELLQKENQINMLIKDLEITKLQNQLAPRNKKSRTNKNKTISNQLTL